VTISLALLGRVGGDVHQRGDTRVRPRLGDDGAAVAVTDQHDRSAQALENAPGCGDVVFQSRKRLLHDGDVVPVAFEIDLPPACAAGEQSNRRTRPCQFAQGQQ